METEKTITLRGILQNILERGENFKLVFSKKRDKNSDIVNIIANPIILKNNPVIKCVFRKANRDETQNFERDEFMVLLITWLEDLFFNADLFTSKETYHVLQNKKGKISLVKKNAVNILPESFDHDHQKKSFIHQEAPYYKQLGLISGQGNVFSKGQKKYNQINKYIETVSHLLADEDSSDTFSIADMGSGKAYLTFALYDYLVRMKGWKVTITGFEARQDLVILCNQLAKENGMVGLQFETCSIDKAPIEKRDMVIALHACDIATDMAIAHGIECGAKYIVLAPCCHKQIRQSMEGENILSPVLRYGILKERQAEIITDGMRALLLQYMGYQTNVFEFISMEHTKKNVMITALKSKPSPQAMQEFHRIKTFFGIPFHYLEKLLKL